MPDIPWFITNAISAAAAFGAIAAALVARRSHRAATSPHVIAYVYVTMDYPQTAMLRVENIGQAPAYETRAEVDDATLERLSACAPGLGMFAKSPWPFLPPGGSRETFLGRWPEFAAAMEGHDGTATVSYSAKKGGQGVARDLPYRVALVHGNRDAVPRHDRPPRARRQLARGGRQGRARVARVRASASERERGERQEHERRVDGHGKPPAAPIGRILEQQARDQRPEAAKRHGGPLSDATPPPLVVGGRRKRPCPALPRLRGTFGRGAPKAWYHRSFSVRPSA